jgi:hypothetical protein
MLVFKTFEIVDKPKLSGLENFSDEIKIVSLQSCEVNFSAKEETNC